MSAPTIAVLLSEATLSLYPILIKNVDTDLATQLFFRLGTYSTLTGVLADRRDIATTWGSINGVLTSLIYGLMNLVHIGSSYIGFRDLPAGTAMSIFYIYPIFNVLAGVLFLGEKFNTVLLPFFAAALLGVYLVATSGGKVEGLKDVKNKKEAKPSNTVRGIVAVLIAALTETLIFVVAKIAPGSSNALYPMLQLYVGAFFLLCGGLVGVRAMPDLRAATVAPLVLFNVFIGFVGYLMRFYAIPLLPTAIFSILSFVGVITAYGWGKLFADETPGLRALLGSLLITASIGGVQFLRS